ncbi:TPA: hypothetical protein ACKQDI_004777 [Serratia marcescens]|jgi:hypothetical protein
MDKTNIKMAGVYAGLLLAWWGGWLTLDAWRTEHLLTNVNKWVEFRQDIIFCAISAMFSVLALLMHERKKTAVWSLVFTLAVMLIITALIVGGSSFIHWQFNTAMFWSLYQWAGLVPLALVPFVTFFLARIDDFF